MLQPRFFRVRTTSLQYLDAFASISVFCQSFINLSFVFLFQTMSTESSSKCPKCHHHLSKETHSILGQSHHCNNPWGLTGSVSHTFSLFLKCHIRGKKENVYREDDPYTQPTRYI